MPNDWNLDIAGQYGQPGPQGVTGATGSQGPIGSTGPGYLATSTTNFVIGTGSMTFTTQGGLAYTIGARARVSSHADPTQWMEGLVTAYDGVSQLTINVDLNNQIAGIQGSAYPIVVAGAGRLQYVSTSALSFQPYNGNLIKINGIFFTIPVAGIVGLSNTGVFINGVSGQNLAATTLYYVYCFNNSGVLTADFSTTAYAISTSAGNAGTFIKTGDDTRSLIGMVYTSSPAGFYDSSSARLVRSWFNAPSVTGYGDAGGSFTNTSFTAFGNLTSWVQFAGESLNISSAGYSTNNAGNGTNWFMIYVDGAQWSQQSVIYFAGYVNAPMCLSFNDLVAEGRHTAQLYGYTNAGTGTINARTSFRLSR